jgi:putative transcriptional regulator
MKNKVKHFRFLNGEFTQQELAEKVQVTRQTIIAIEKGNFNPSIKLVLKISRALNTPVEMLFELEEKDLV